MSKEELKDSIKYGAAMVATVFIMLLLTVMAFVGFETQNIWFVMLPIPLGYAAFVALSIVAQHYAGKWNW
jgi:hypothetical protein